MASKKIPIDIDIKTREAQRRVKDLNREISNTEDGIDDTATAGQKMARALEMSADQMITELEGTRLAVDALERALGADFDADVTDVVADLKRIGLTTDEIAVDADELAAALRRAGDVRIRAKELGFDDVDQALGRTTDNGRVTSTAIGGIGNSISELPGVGSLGPVAESMGMLAENALEGEANLKGLVVAGGGLAAVGLGVQLVQGHFEKLAKIKTWETEQISEWSEAIYEAEDAVNALAESYAQAGTVEVRTLLNGVQDVTSELARSGITIDEWTKAVQGGSTEVEDISLKLQAAGLSSGQMENVLTGLVFAQDQYSTATREAAERTAVFGTSADDAATDTGNLTTATDDAEAAADEFDGTLGREIDSLRYAGLAAEEAETKTRELEQAYSDLRGELSDQSAYLDVQDSFDDLLEKGKAAFDGTEESARAHERAIIDTKSSIIDYIEEIGNVPAETTSRIMALLDQGKVAEAEAELGRIARNRTVVFTAKYGGGYDPRGGVDGDPTTPYHTGGVAGGMKFKSDEVPAVLQKGEVVLTKGQQESVAGAMAGAGGITINHYGQNLSTADINRAIRMNRLAQ